MKKINISLIKDLIISILIVVCIILIILLVLYNKVSINKLIPESQEYALSEEMQEDLSQTEDEETTTIITTYSIDATDLKQYEKNNQYVKGKQNPFASESEGSTSNIINGNTSTNSTSSDDSLFYEDNGLK